MRLAPAIGALLCASALLLSSCGSPAADDSAQASSSAQQADGSAAEPDGDANAADAADAAAADAAAADVAAGSGDADAGDAAADPGVADPGPDADAADADSSTALPDLDALFGEGGCMEIANVMMGWGFALLGPLMEGTTLSQDDADALFAATESIPTEIEPHIAVLRTAIDAAVDQPQSKVIEIVGSPEVTDAMNGLTAYSEGVCGGDESAG